MEIQFLGGEGSDGSRTGYPFWNHWRYWYGHGTFAEPDTLYS